MIVFGGLQRCKQVLGIPALENRCTDTQQINDARFENIEDNTEDLDRRIDNVENQINDLERNQLDEYEIDRKIDLAIDDLRNEIEDQLEIKDREIASLTESLSRMEQFIAAVGLGFALRNFLVD